MGADRPHSVRAHLLTPRSFCVACGRPFYTDKRRPCRCGETGRAFTRSASDMIRHVDIAR